MFESSPPAESLPPPLFSDSTTTTNLAISKPSNGATSWHNISEDIVLPLTPKGIRHFEATVVSPSSENRRLPDSNWQLECPRWSGWALGQFTFDYLFTVITSSMTSEVFKERYPEQYMNAIFKLNVVIESIGKLPDGSPPPSFFQSFYYLKRLFPNGLVVAHDFVGEVGTTLLLRVFALGIVVANQAIFEQRNLNLCCICREDMCGIPDSYVDAFETAGLYALNGDVFDLFENKTIYLDWLAHLMYYAEFHHFRTGHTYLRNSTDLFAFAHAHALSLPQNYGRNHIHPIHLPFLETLSIMVCWNTGVTPFPVQAIQHGKPDSQSASHVQRNMSRILRPTAADVLAAVAEECVSRLLYPLAVRTNSSYCSASSSPTTPPEMVANRVTL
ncbi:hypothetical protein B0H19DRAFT_1176991 [Mycena capillaripes]|nr:hypothetical protein B0H19DRAFT_1176991 [Mycena capillaripes]